MIKDQMPIECEVEDIDGVFYVTNLKYEIHVFGDTLELAITRFNAMFYNNLHHYRSVPTTPDNSRVKRRYMDWLKLNYESVKL